MLFWGVLGALVLRGIMIALGVVLLKMFHWIIYLFGAFLLFIGIRMCLHKEAGVHPERNPLLKLVRRIVPVTCDYEGDRFMVQRGGQIWATPLLLVLLVIETTDLIFALDSIPAILAVTQDPFLVYTSNVFAILGLRSTPCSEEPEALDVGARSSIGRGGKIIACHDHLDKHTT